MCWGREGWGAAAPSPVSSEGLGVAALSAHRHPNRTHHLLPHQGPCLLTFSMTPTTLQPLSCSRAELSVRMGRSLRLLKPCGGETAQGPALLSQAVGRASSCRGAQGVGKNGVRSSLTSQGQASREAGPDLGVGPTALFTQSPHLTPHPPQPFSKAPGVPKASEASLSPGGRCSRGWGNNLGTCGSQGTCLENQGMWPRHVIWGKVSLGGVRVHVYAHLWA